MGETARTVAMLVRNPALSSILSMTLAASPFLRVRPFESQLALTTYLGLAPIDLLVCDLDFDILGEALARRSGQRKFEVIALVSSMTAKTKDAAIRAGIDEVIIKPMSPRYLLERVVSRLTWRIQPAPKSHAARQPRTRAGQTAETWAKLGDNIVPLFGREPRILH